MRSSSAPPPIPHDPGCVSDAVKPIGRRDVVAVAPRGMDLPDKPINDHDTGAHARGMGALKGELGALHGCDGLTRRTRAGVVCE